MDSLGVIGIVGEAERVAQKLDAVDALKIYAATATIRLLLRENQRVIGKGE